MFRKSKSIKRFVAVATAVAVMASGVTISGRNAGAEDTKVIGSSELKTISGDNVYDLDISQGDTLEIDNITSYGNIKLNIIEDFDNNYDRYKDVYGKISSVVNLSRTGFTIGIADGEIQYYASAPSKATITYSKNNTPIVSAGIVYDTSEKDKIKAAVTSGDNNNTYDCSIVKSQPEDDTYDVTYLKNDVSGYYSIKLAKEKKEITYKDPSNNHAIFTKIDENKNIYRLIISQTLVKKYGIKIKLNDKEINPTAEPTATPTAEPTATPTAEPTTTPTVAPTAAPTTEPTAAPTEEPTAVPTAEPTEAPTAEPTAAPTMEPTEAPTATPTAEPTKAPTATPTAEPTKAPTEAPTAAPTAAPTKTPDIESLVSTQPSNNTVALSWTVSNPSAAQTYEILLDGAVFATGVTATSYTCTGLAAGTHTIKVVAVNGAVKSVGKSVSVSVKMEISIKKNGVSHVYMYDADKPYVLPANHKGFIAAYPELVTKGYVFDGFLDAGRKLVKSVSNHSELTIKWRPLSTKFSSVKLKKGTLTFKFSKADWNNIDGYKISYSLDRKMKKKVKSITVAKKGKKQVYNFTKAKKLLKNGAIYYFNVKFYYKNKAGKKVFYEGNTTNKPIRYYKK